VTNDRRFDAELQKKDILNLSDADGVAAFFAMLRYDTSTRITQTPAALGISEAIARPIKRIEMLAGHDLLQVYLVELTSVTMKATRDLARSFRDRAGNFLFVLTSDLTRQARIPTRNFTPRPAMKPQSRSPLSIHWGATSTAKTRRATRKGRTRIPAQSLSHFSKIAVSLG
jgi:hypothetical protein